MIDQCACFRAWCTGERKAKRKKKKRKRETELDRNDSSDPDIVAYFSLGKWIKLVFRKLIVKNGREEVKKNTRRGNE